MQLLNTSLRGGQGDQPVADGQAVPPGPAARGLARADRYLAQAHAVALTRSGQDHDRWALAAAAIDDARALLYPGRDLESRDPHTDHDLDGGLGRRVATTTGQHSCAHLIQMALTQLRWLPPETRSPARAQAFGIAWAALRLIEPFPTGAGPASCCPADGRALASFLDTGCFPARRERLLEHAADHGAPPSVLHLLMGLPHHRSWPDLAAVLRELDLSDGTGR